MTCGVNMGKRVEPRLPTYNVPCEGEEGASTHLRVTRHVVPHAPYKHAVEGRRDVCRVDEARQVCRRDVIQANLIHKALQVATHTTQPNSLGRTFT